MNIPTTSQDETSPAESSSVESSLGEPSKSESLYTEIDKSIEFDGETLHGTLCVPAGKKPSQVFLMIAGSGEVDRNSNALQIQLNIFNALANSLAAEGIASLRFDKRGCAMSGGNFHETGFFNFVDDAEAWMNSIRSFEEVSGADIFLLGHSEGTLIASILSTSNDSVRGQVLLTPFLENLELTIERQLQRTLAEVQKLTGFKGMFVRVFLRLSGNQLTKQRRVMKRVKNSTKPTMKLKKTLINAKWLREIMSVEPTDVYSKVTVPTLSIGAEKDVQCLPEHAQMVQEYVKGPVDCHMLSDLTHILRIDHDEPSTFKYKELSQQPIDTRVSELIVRWMRQQ